MQDHALAQGVGPWIQFALHSVESAGEVVGSAKLAPVQSCLGVGEDVVVRDARKPCVFPQESFLLLVKLQCDLVRANDVALTPLDRFDFDERITDTKKIYRREISFPLTKIS